MKSLMIGDVLAAPPPRCSDYRLVIERRSPTADIRFSLPVPEEWKVVEPRAGLASWLGGTPILGVECVHTETLVEISAMRLTFECDLGDLVPILVENAGHQMTAVVARTRTVEVAARDQDDRPVHVRALRNGRYVLFASGSPGTGTDAYEKLLVALAGFRPLHPARDFAEPFGRRPLGSLTCVVPEAWKVTASSATRSRLVPPWRESHPSFLDVDWIEDPACLEALMTRRIEELETQGLIYGPASVERVDPVPGAESSHAVSFLAEYRGSPVHVAVHASRFPSGSSLLTLVAPRRPDSPIEWARATHALRVGIATQTVAVTKEGPTP